MKKRHIDNIRNPPPDWKAAFQGSAMRTSFCLALTQPMLEFLCATADGVHWDRQLYSAQWGAAKPNNWIASEASLTKRGLIERIPRKPGPDGLYRLGDPQDAACRLTPVGEALVTLLKVAGIFIESDSAAARKAGA